MVITLRSEFADEYGHVPPVGILDHVDMDLRLYQDEFVLSFSPWGLTNHPSRVGAASNSDINLSFARQVGPERALPILLKTVPTGFDAVVPQSFSGRQVKPLPKRAKYVQVALFSASTNFDSGSRKRQ